nr:MAG TPA: hypothetical protein [Bacteriophage sp.]
MSESSLTTLVGVLSKLSLLSSPTEPVNLYLLYVVSFTISPKDFR